MILCDDLTKFKNAFPQNAPIHLAIGVFDGAHRGHQAIFQAAKSAAQASRGNAVALTFSPHPQNLFGGAGTVKLIYSVEQRVAAFEKAGFTGTICQPFTREFASVPAEEFLPFLKNHVPELAGIYCGENFCFGKQRRGNAKNLPELAAKIGIAAKAVPAVLWQNELISSTRIRAAIAAGTLDAVNAMLGEHYFAEGTVIRGNQLGRTIGFPTLNVAWNPETRPPFGAYAVRVAVLDDAAFPQIFSGIANFGIRPTVGDLHDLAPLLETHLLVPANTHVPTTGAKIRVFFEQFIRRERKFSSLNELKTQLEIDKISALKLLKNPFP